jgi:membrane-bound lytic murein transglycosylase A
MPLRLLYTAAHRALTFIFTFIPMFGLSLIILRAAGATALLLLAACDTLMPAKPPVVIAPSPAPAPTTPVPAPAPPPAAETPTLKPPVIGASALRATTFESIPNWRDDDPQQAWGAFLTSCGTLRNQAAWQAVCSTAATLTNPTRESAARFFESQFTPYQVVNADGTDTGLVTGYYEPLLNGSRKRSARYHVPVYGVPDDLLVIDLGESYPDLKNMRLRGRVEGRRVVPYFNRAQIESGSAPVAGKEIVWVEDSVELFFMQIQGSGRVRLDGKDTIALGYADQNGYPYRSIGRLLVERGDLPLEKASMQGIKAWARQNPDKLQELLNYNASYVFFREMPRDLPGPLGALGVPLTARRSIAVDARYVPLGAPVFLATTMPNARQPLNRLVLAQDTGGAIRGAVRADFFWGFGDEAAALAGRMKQSGKMWVLLPTGYPVPAAN